MGRQRGERCADIRKERWEAVKKEAFIHVAYERNAKRLLAELGAAGRARADTLTRRALFIHTVIAVLLAPARPQRH